MPDTNPLVITEIPRLRVRPADSNKGSFGRVLVVAGSRGMSGAAVLCGSAALRGGAGLVRVASPASISPIVANGNPCYMTVPLPEDADGRVSASAGSLMVELANSTTAAVIGPGLGQPETLAETLRAVLMGTTIPLVLDADALNAIAARPGDLLVHDGPTIITPHPGEFARLIASDVVTVQSHRQELAVRFAREHNVVVVLKGHGTVITDGNRVAINATGNPGMSTGGTGDVLAGLVAALLAQGLEAFDAARLGAHIHGLAGDLARDARGEVGMIASDLLDYLPLAFRAHEVSAKHD